jgi:hypothetical protein
MAIGAGPWTNYRRALSAAGTALAAGVGLLLGPAQTGATAPGGNGRIAYEFTDDNVDTTLRDVLPGRRPRQLTRVPRRCRPADRYRWADEWPRYSPDGNWIVYRHLDNCRRSRAYRHQIRLVRADGRGMRILFGAGANLRAGMYPVFSRDGSRILFIGRTRSSDRFWIIDARSGQVLRRPRLPARFNGRSDYTTLDWSPAGQVALAAYPAIFSGRPGAGFTNYRRLTTPSAPDDLIAADSAADWSPNGKSLLFTRTVSCLDSDDPGCPFDQGAELRDIYRVFTSGELRLQRLTRDGAFYDPVFSPDGRSMVFFEDYRGLVVRPLAGGPGRLLTTNGFHPTWQSVTRATLSPEPSMTQPPNEMTFPAGRT